MRRQDTSGCWLPLLTFASPPVLRAARPWSAGLGPNPSWGITRYGTSEKVLLSTYPMLLSSFINWRAATTGTVSECVSVQGRRLHPKYLHDLGLARPATDHWKCKLRHELIHSLQTSPTGGEQDKLTLIVGQCSKLFKNLGVVYLRNVRKATHTMMLLYVRSIFDQAIRYFTRCPLLR